MDSAGVAAAVPDGPAAVAAAVADALEPLSGGGAAPAGANEAFRIAGRLTAMTPTRVVASPTPTSTTLTPCRAIRKPSSGFITIRDRFCPRTSTDWTRE